MSALLGRVVWLSLLPLLVLAAVLAAGRVRADQADARATAERQLEASIDGIDGFVDARVRALSVLANSRLADDPTRWPDLYDEALGFLASFGSHVIFADADRQMLFNTRVPFGTVLPRLPDSTGRTAAFVALADGVPAVGDLVQGPVIDEALVAIVVPGLRDGVVRYLLLVTTTVAEFQAIVDRSPLPEGWSMTLRDGTGALIAGRAPAGFDAARDVDPRWRFEAATAMTPWRVAIEVPRAIQRQTLFGSLASMLAAVVVATLGGLWGGRGLARRIESEVAVMADVDGGGSRPSGIAEFATARRRLESSLAAVRESETRLRLSVEAANIGLWDWDLRTDAVVYSPEWKAQLGLRDDEVAPSFDAWRDRVHPDDLEPALERIRAYLADPRGRHVAEFRMRHADGRFRWIVALADVLRDAEGHAIRMIGCHIDVTNRREAEDALRASHRRLERIMENDAVGVMVWYVPEGRLIDANETFLRQTGYDREDVRSGTITWQRLTPPEYIDQSLAEMAAFDVSGRIGPYEKEYLRKDGSRIWMVFAGSALDDDQVVEFCVDISDRKRAEEAWRSEADFNEATLTGLPGVLLCCDEALTSQRWNDNFERVTGYAAPAIARMQPTAFFASEDRDRVAERIRAAFETGAADLEAEVVARDGTATPFDFSLVAADIGGRRHVVAVGIDATERRRAVGRLRQAASVFENANEAIMITDLDGTILDVNDAFERITGYARDEALGRNPRMLQSGRHDAGFYAEMWRDLNEHGVWRGELWNRRKDGVEYAELLTISAIRDASGRPQRYVGLFADITALKDQQVALEGLVASRTRDLVAAKEAAERANQAKGVFLASMSHELRTPMNGVLGMIDLARQRLDDPEASGYLAKADVAARHLLALLNDVLDLSKIDAQRLTLERAPLTIAQVIADLVGLLGDRAAAKGLSLDADVDPVLAARTFDGDALRLRQVLVNLVGNAIKFSDQGHVRVAARLAEADAEAAVVRFEVSDQGVGIAPEDQERVFAAFEQADGSPTRAFGGAGLGLAISKRLVELMGGAIGVVSAPGTGSRFWFTVRLAHGRPGSTPGPIPESVDALRQRLAREHRGARVLVAEDEPINREILGHQLGAAGLSCDEARDGVEAVALARQGRYDLILMDVMMPRLDGLDAARAIRADSMNRDTPMLAMTANVFAEDRQKSLDAGMDDHLGKPAPPTVLYAALLAWLERGRVRRADGEDGGDAGGGAGAPT